MNSFIYHLLIFISISIKSGFSHSSGAPSSACTSMLPRHGVSSQQCSSKYLIESDKLQYHTSDTLLFVVQQMMTHLTKTNQQIIGTWSVVGSDIKTLNCGGIDNTGITHNSHSDKSSIEALWHPPSTIIEDSIVIKATIVHSYHQIYVDCFNITLTAKSTDTTTTVASTGLNKEIQEVGGLALPQAIVVLVLVGYS
ncbi:unnamed protein product [Rotaria sordida]|uniref:Reelin domain-containing protein n=1 Tax=Rotaria sordida TaxID=392033 RepID=A0A819MWT1_9BILA|nr:unnamed protein product [Rotaria sordida]